MTLKDVGFAVLHAVEASAFRFRRFGRGSIVAPFPRRIVGARYATIGERCFLGAGLTLWICDDYLGREHRPRFDVGDRTMIGRDVVIACTHSITIGSAVTVADRAFIGDSYHGYENPDIPVLDQPMAGQAAVEIGDGCFIGVGAAVLPGVTLGRGCVVAANAVVTRSFGPNTVLLGNPARPIRTFDRAKNAWVP